MSTCKKWGTAFSEMIALTKKPFIKDSSNQSLFPLEIVHIKEEMIKDQKNICLMKESSKYHPLDLSKRK